MMVSYPAPEGHRLIIPSFVGEVHRVAGATEVETRKRKLGYFVTSPLPTRATIEVYQPPFFLRFLTLGA